MLKAFPGRRLHFILAFCLATTAILGTLTLVPAPSATYAAEETAGLLQPGDIAASGFSGVKLQVEGLPPGVDPLTKTVIDPDGITLHVFGTGPFTGPLGGQRLVPPLRKEFKAKDIGHVFGLAFDALPADDRGTPGLYAAATSAFGLYIVGPDKDGDGQPDRLMKGAAGAQFMDGLFGRAAPSGGAGAIWKIDSVTGEASLYAELSHQGVNNSGPAIGGLAFDPVSRSLYVADLDTGLIHQLKGAATGTDLAQYDHGLQGRPLAGKDSVADDAKRLDITSPDFDTANPATWAFTQIERRIDGMAVHGKRLYYAVAEGPEVWSVGLAEDGSFLQDARIEAGVTISQPGTVTAIAFGNDGGMILGIRNAVQNTADYSALAGGGPADVIRYAPESPDDPQTASPWQIDTLTYPVGQSAERRDGSGGVALQYAYKPDGGLDLAACGGTLIASGDLLGPQKTGHGLQIGQASQFQTAAGADIPTAFVSLDPAQDDAAARGHAGGVAVLSQCEGGGGFPSVASDETPFPGVADGGGGGQTGFPGVENGGGGQAGLPGVENGGGGQTNFPGVEGGGGQTNPAEGGGGQTDFPEVEGGGGTTNNLTLAKMGTVEKCSPKGGCAFNIEVRNSGPEVKGPITINELIEAPQATLTGEPNDPWQCSKAAPFTCTHPGPVPANGKLTMRVVFAPNTPADAKELKNCAAIAGGVQQPGENQPAAPVCATLALDPNVPVQTGPVVISKKGPASCPLKGPCTFEITLTNTTDAPVPGPIPFTDTISVPGAKLSEQALPAPFACEKGGPPFKCSFGNAATSLGPKESRSVSLRFDLDLPAGTTEVENCAVKPAAPAPQKKAGLLPVLPHSKVQFSQWNSPAPKTSQSLLHLVAGDNNAGIGFAACESWKWTGLDGGFSITQSNKIVVSFVQLKIADGGNVVGRARYSTPNGIMWGNVTGSYLRNHFEFRVVWDNRTSGRYVGDVGSNGQPAGTIFDQKGGKSQFSGIQNHAHFACDDARCIDGVKEINDKQNELRRLGSCVGANDILGDIKGMCVSHPDFFERFKKLKDDEIRNCLAAKAQEIEKNCNAVAAVALEKNGEMKALGCKDAIAGLTPNTIITACKLRAMTPDAIAQSFQGKIDACKAQLAAGGAGNAGGGNAGGGQAGQEQEPAPEQCTVVKIENVDAPGKDQGEQGPVAQQPEQPPQPPQPSVQGDLTVLKTFSKTPCVGNSCVFNITITSTMKSHISSPLQFTEEVTGDGKFFAGATVTVAEIPAAKFTCFPQPTGFNCFTNKAEIPPLGSLNLTVTADLGKDAVGIKQMRNCAGMRGAATLSCDTAPLQAQDPPPAKDGVANLAAQVIPPNAGANGVGVCAVDSACRFIVKVSSNGAVPFKAKSSFDTKVDNGLVELIGAKAAGNAGGFVCGLKGGDGQTQSCQADTQLPPQSFLTTDVTVVAGARWKKNDTLTLCANLTAPDGNPADDRACASVKLDPFSVKVSKTGDQQCVAGGECRFNITLFNPGPIDHNAPVTISDKLTGLSSAQIASITPPLPCAAQPTQVPFTCTSPGDVSLPLEGPPQVFSMVLKLPNDATAKQFSNCAGIADAAGAASAEESCVTVKSLPPPAATVGDLTVAKSAASASCSETEPCQFRIAVTNNGTQPFPGPIAVYDMMSVNNAPMTQYQLVSGPPVGWTCVASAAPGMQCSMPGPLPPKATVELTLGLQPLAGSLGAASKIDNCAEIEGAQAQQKSCASIALKQAPAQPAACNFGMVLTSAGLCACPPGSSWDGKSCSGASSASKPLGSGGVNMTKPGDEQPKPALPIISAEPATCKFGMILASTGLCQCPANTKWNGKACEVGKGGGGFDMIKQAPEQAKSCPAGRPLGTYPNCCPQGTEYRNGNCRYQRVVPDQAKQQGKVCPADRPVGAYPNCCPRGSQYSNGKCRYTKPAQVKCPRSQKLDPATNTCIDRAPAAQRICPADRPIGAYPNCCPRGYQFARGTCRRFREQRQQQQYCPADRPVGVYPNCCPDGYQFGRGRCRPVRQQQQQQQYCPPDRPVGVYPNCCPDGYRFGRGRCRPVREQQQQQQQQQQPDQSNRPARKRCPDGSVVYGRYSQCPNDKPAPRPQPQQQQCTGGKVSTPNGCVCPSGMSQTSSGQCVDSVR